MGDRVMVEHIFIQHGHGPRGWIPGRVISGPYLASMDHYVVEVGPCCGEDGSQLLTVGPDRMRPAGGRGLVVPA